MLQKKICLLGAFSVGKTSLIRRYVDSLFNDKYLTTVGVKIDKKQVQINGTELSLMIWDVAGKDDFTSIRPAYLRGMAGCIIVVDGTRSHSCETALEIHNMVQDQVGPVPVIFALNKADLKTNWQVDPQQIHALYQTEHTVIETSAKLDQGVETVFTSLAQQLVA